MNVTSNIQRDYGEKAKKSGNVMKREYDKGFYLKSFNNWIKAVLINYYSRQMCEKIEKALDLPKGDSTNRLLHILDIGCGRGQDIKKWKLSRVKYMVANDFSEDCLKTYEERWMGDGQPYRLLTTCCDFTSKDLYSKIEHSYYDIVSAQFCFHYMFNNQGGLRNGLTSILSNLLIQGVFIATIPDSYVILKKLKEQGQPCEDGVKYGNKYYSIKFKDTQFTNPFGNQYSFYLQGSVGNKLKTGQIQYTNEWLISLDHLQQILKVYGVQIEETMNFLQFYLKHRSFYRDLFPKLGLIFKPGESIDADLWQIAHLYRVLICRKQNKGIKIEQFNLNDRNKATNKQIKAKRNCNTKDYKSKSHQNRKHDDSHRERSYRKNSHNNNY